jgi:hypothetical protein
MVTASAWDLAIEPAVERVGRRWYAADATALLADPQGLPEHAIDEIRAWVRSGDINVRERRPFTVECGPRGGDTRYSFDRCHRLSFAPAWWAAAGRQFDRRHAMDERGRRRR